MNRNEANDTNQRKAEKKKAKKKKQKEKKKIEKTRKQCSVSITVLLCFLFLGRSFWANQLYKSRSTV